MELNEKYPISFYSGLAINIGADDCNKKDGKIDTVLIFPVKYNDGSYYDKFTTKKVFVAESLEDIESDEFLGLKDGVEIENFKPYELFVLKNSLLEISRSDIAFYFRFLGDSRINTEIKLNNIERIVLETAKKRAKLVAKKQLDIVRTKDAYRKFQEAFQGEVKKEK